MVAYARSSVLERQSQEDQEFKASFGCHGIDSMSTPPHIPLLQIIWEILKGLAQTFTKKCDTNKAGNDFPESPDKCIQLVGKCHCCADYISFISQVLWTDTPSTLSGMQGAKWFNTRYWKPACLNLHTTTTTLNISRTQSMLQNNHRSRVWQ